MPYTKEVVEHLKHERRLFLAINVCAAVAIGILFWLIAGQQSKLTHEDVEIQHQRFELILRDCRDLNARHDRSIKVLDKKLHFIGGSRADEERKLVRPLVDALVPKRNCVKYAISQVPNHDLQP